MNSKLFHRFLNHRVGIIMKSVRGSQVLGDNQVVEGNVVIEGILLDEDEEFFYLGTDSVIDDAVRKDDVVRIFDSIEDRISDFELEEIDGDVH